MTYKLFLDDERMPDQVTWVNIHHDDRPWVIVRNVEDFKRCVMARGLPDYVSFDHDLQDWHYAGNYLDEKTGLDAAKWLIEYCRSRQIPRPAYAIHSMSPVGRYRIEAAMSSP